MDQLKVNVTIAELVQQRDMALGRCVEMRIQLSTDAAANAEKIASLEAKVKELEAPKPEPANAE